MKKNFFGFLCLSLISLDVLAVEAPADMTQFNIACPAKIVAPVLGHAYHECKNGYNVEKSCATFLLSVRQLIPEYDCQRSFDATPTKNYIVPAIWLVGDAEMESYVSLLALIASGKDKIFSKPDFKVTTRNARELFLSKEFRNVLDGGMAEDYLPKIKRVEHLMRASGN